MLTEEKVRSLEAERARAMLEADTNAIENLFFETAAYIHSAGAIDTRQIFIDRLASGDLDYQSIDTDIEMISIQSDTALVVGIHDISLHRGGMPVELHIRYSAVWMAFEDSGKLLSFQATIMPQ